MIKVTSLLLFLLTSVCGTGNAAQDVCRQVIVKKAADCDVKTVCCAATTQDPRCQVILKKVGEDDVKMVYCGAIAQDPYCQVIVKKAGDRDLKTLGGAAAPDVCRPLNIKTVGDSVTNAVRLASGLAFVVGEDDQKAGRKIVLRSGAPKLEVWIGVRVTPVPEPLASHLKRGGLMIANVAEDSPADRAGVERYDIVVSFAGSAIENMDDLLAAIRDTGAANTAELVVIRGGKKKTLTITPAERGDASALSFKYEEPEAAEVDQFKKYFGGRLRVGPGGMGFFMPYGRMDRLPDDVKELLEDVPHIDWQEWSDRWEEWSEKWKKFRHMPFDVHIDIDSDDWGAWSWFPDLEDADLKAEIRIRVEEDGETITIERAEDGTITVERDSADGDRSSDTYEDVEQLRKEDPKAYKTYRRFLVLRSPRALIVSPDLKDLGARQREFQIELKAQLDKAREQVQEAMKQARKARKEVEIRMRNIRGADDIDVRARSETVMLFVDDDGRITLEIDDDGVSRRYEFDSREDFKSSEPELYERFKKHLDETDAGAQNDALEPTSARPIA